MPSAENQDAIASLLPPSCAAAKQFAEQRNWFVAALVMILIADEAWVRGWIGSSKGCTQVPIQFVPHLMTNTLHSCDQKKVFAEV